jgi:hypothetical protein
MGFFRLFRLLPSLQWAMMLLWQGSFISKKTDGKELTMPDVAGAAGGITSNKHGLPEPVMQASGKVIVFVTEEHLAMATSS